MDSSFAVYAFSETPGAGNWRFVTLEKHNSHGSVMEWSIGYDAAAQELVIEYSGNSEAKRDAVVPKSNRNHLQQALLMARHRYSEKIRNGYLAQSAASGPLFTPQLARRYEGKGLEAAHFRAGLAVQGKADGVRCIPYTERGVVVLCSRQNTIFPAPLVEVRGQMAVLMQYIPPNARLDGELYAHGVPLQEIRSVLTNSVDVEGYEDIRYCIFDIAMSEVVLEERINLLLNAFSAMIADGHAHDKLQLMRHTYVTSREALDDVFQRYLALGFEGVVVRQLAGPQCEFRERSYYTQKRNANLWKYKPVWEDEGEIIEVFPAKRERGGDGRGAAMFRLRLESGAEFNIRPVGTVEERVSWMDEPERFLGRTYTFKYLGFTNAGIPIHAVGKAFRDHAY